MKEEIRNKDDITKTYKEKQEQQQKKLKQMEKHILVNRKNK